MGLLMLKFNETFDIALSSLAGAIQTREESVICFKDASYSLLLDIGFA